MVFKFLFLINFLSISSIFALESSSIYEILKSNGLPMGLLPKGVTQFNVDDSGRFQVNLERECNAKFENELHYDRNVTGTISYGQIADLAGISAQDLFLWFPVKVIYVDVPSSGVIYFDVGVVSKQFSLSIFETPKECTAAEAVGGVGSIAKAVSEKNLGSQIRYRLDQGDITPTISKTSSVQFA